MQIVKDIVGQKRTKSRANNPSDADFFGCNEENLPEHPKKERNAVRVRDLHSEDFEEFMQMFVFRCDQRAFNRKIGYWKPKGLEGRNLGWHPETKGRLADDPRYIPAIRKHLTERVERHLDHEQWSKRHRPQHWQQPYVLGLLGGESSAVYHYDIDNHGGHRIEYHKDGQNLLVPDLSLSFMKYVQRVLCLPWDETGMPPPCSLNLSSDSLGLYLFFVVDISIKTEVGYGRLRRLAEQHGLGGLEAYPMPMSKKPDASPHLGRNVHRLPCGHGSAALTVNGMLTGWREQFWNFFSGEPLPSMPLIAEMLLQRWMELHERWRPDFQAVASERLEHVETVTAEIRAWVRADCPGDDNGQVAEVVHEAVSQPVVRPQSTNTVLETRTIRTLSHPDLLYKIATAGCPEQGQLNKCTVMIARHLMQYELVGEDKEQVAFDTLSAWCLSRHNDCSSRLSPGDIVLPKDVESVIWRDIKSVDCEHGVNPKNTLFLRWLITGEGPENRYGCSSPIIPPSHHDLLNVSTLLGTTNRAQSYEVAELAAISLIRSGELDKETSKVVEYKIQDTRMQFKTFARRLTNFLLLKTNNEACIHTNLWMAMASTKSTETMSRFKKAIILENIVKVTNPIYVLGGRSKQYQLHPSVRSAMGEAGGPVSEDDDP